jgi:hypothetical protein
MEMEHSQLYVIYEENVTEEKDVLKENVYNCG